MSQESEYVINLLKGSVSTIESVRNEASVRIIELESNISFLSTLLDIATTRNDDFSKLSFIILKNSFCKILSRLKTNDPNANVDYPLLLSEIKLKLLQTINFVYEAHSVIIPKEFCLLIRSVFRSEFPLNSPELYDFFILRLKSIENTIDVRAFNLIFLLHHVFKERISMRLFKDRNVTNQIAEQFFPYLSKIWSNQFFNKWKKLELNPDTFNSEFDPVQLKFNLYLDSIILNFYSHCFRNVYKNQELLQLLSNLFLKFKIISKVSQNSNVNSENIKILVKNVLRILKGFTLLVEKVPYDFVFLDFSTVLNQVFDFLIHSGIGFERVETESIRFMTTIFSSSSMNHDKYSTIYFENLEPIPVVQSSVSPINSPKNNYKLDINNVPYYKSFEELVNLNPSLKQIELEDLMERQLTFYFYKVLNSRGGFLKFLDLLRTKYLLLDEKSVELWNEEEFPTTSPTLNLVPELISCMNIKLVGVFNFTFNSLLNFKLNNLHNLSNLNDVKFFEYDTFLQIYTLCFKDFYNFHTYKHYILLLETFGENINVLENEKSNVLFKFSKLLVFRISRIVNLWCKKPLITQETKAKILSFLIKCISSQNLQLKAQNLVPLYNLYNNSKDENIWPLIFKNHPTSPIINNLLLISTTSVPVIRIRSLELACNLSLEYDESNLEGVLELYTKLESPEICEAILKTILYFIGSLDWVKCYTDFDTLNYNFITFVIKIIINTVVVGKQGNFAVEYDVSGLQIVSVTKYSVIDELFLSVWLGFLRILPLDIGKLECLSQIFTLFGPFLEYICNSETLEDTLFNKLAIEILIEYISLLNTIQYKEYTVGQEIKNCYSSFNLTKLYKLTNMNSFDNSIGTVLLNLMIAVVSTFGVKENMTEYYGILNMFFNSLESILPADSINNQFMALGVDQKWTKFQPMKIKKESLVPVGRLLPLINKIILSNKILESYFRSRSIVNFESWINDRILTMIIMTNLYRNQPFAQIGLILLTCSVISTFPQLIYPFIKFSGSSLNSLDKTVNLQDSSFVMCFLLKVLSSVCDDYRGKHLTISQEKVENYQIPPSNRFELVKNKALVNTNSQILFQGSFLF
ncbi:uncharacterized protein TA06400 [Theileria annulata]|uniref:Uncharacterized protein n=1 Tax=Theileria annulata TaxID=5874 RepID=Q4UIB2_THEAN|nr:uncharacterized protein TA06400 [Theileria annulata]CAI73177.1 hypothetical protein, conserved [Theileria annulata]|eukprot:XP_953855.1 hypothetical protein, conserved [Theileria annulata]